MRVKLVYILERDCIDAHTSLMRPGKQGVMKHDEAKEFFGTPCNPGILEYFQIVEEDEVMDKVEIMYDLGHKVRIEYLTEEESK